MAHAWKACWGQPLAGSNPASSALLTRHDGPLRIATAREGRLAVSVLTCRTPLPPLPAVETADRSSSRIELLGGITRRRGLHGAVGPWAGQVGSARAGGFPRPRGSP